MKNLSRGLALVRTSVLAVAGFGALLGPAGCALLTKQDPLVPRYFSPEPTTAVGELPEARGAHAGLALRLGRIGGSPYLKERIVHRDSSHEIAFYEERRWTERPEAYLRRALERSIFEVRGVRRVVVGGAPTLEAELTDFEVVTAPKAMARLRVTYTLLDDRVVRRQKTLTIEHPIARVDGPDGPDGSAIATGLGAALGAAVEQISAQVLADLAATAGASQAP